MKNTLLLFVFIVVVYMAWLRPKFIETTFYYLYGY